MEVHCNEDFFGFPAGVPIDLSTLECVSYGVTPGVGGPLAGNPFCDLGYPALPGQYSVHNADVNAQFTLHTSPRFQAQNSASTQNVLHERRWERRRTVWVAAFGLAVLWRPGIIRPVAQAGLRGGSGGDMRDCRGGCAVGDGDILVYQRRFGRMHKVKG